MKNKVRLFGFCLLAIAAAALAADPPEASGERIPGFNSASSEQQRRLEARMVELLDPASTARHFRLLTEEPHPAGSEENLKLARAQLEALAGRLQAAAVATSEAAALVLVP